VLRVAHSDQRVNFLNQLLLLVVVKVDVPLGQSGLSSPVLNQDETDLQKGAKIPRMKPPSWHTMRTDVKYHLKTTMVSEFIPYL
jgi:hypothetical protein